MSNNIEIIHCMEEKGGCKIENKICITFYDSSWIAGVGKQENNDEITNTYETDNNTSIAAMDEVNPNKTADTSHEK
jgi:hypothetical protein